MGDHDPTISSSPATTTPTVSAKFREAATALATELELDVDLVINRVLEKKLVSTASDKAAAALTKVPDAKFAEAFSEKSEAEVAMATEAMREALNPKPIAPAVNATGTAADTAAAIAGGGFLPKPEFQENLLTESLRTGGTAKVGKAHVVALVRAVIAERTGINGIPKMLDDLITKRMDDLDEPAPPALRKLRRDVNRRRHSDILAALRKTDDTVFEATEADQRKLLARAQSILIPQLAKFHSTIMTWRQQVMEVNGGNVNGAVLAMMNAHSNPLFARLTAAGSANMNTTPVKNAIEVVNNAINKTFSAVGIEASIALYDEARFCTSLLSQPEIYALVGRGTREEAIRELGVEVTANDQQMEHDLAQYIAGIMEYPKTSSAEHEIGYLAELISVGMGINWDALTSGRRTNGFGGSPYNSGTNNAMGVGSNGHRGANSRDGVR